jgi:hypothetical protein
MSEAAAGGGRAEIERKIIQRSLEDESYRRMLLEDPKAALEEEARPHSRRLARGVRGVRHEQVHALAAEALL